MPIGYFLYYILSIIQKLNDNDANFTLPGTFWCGPGNTSTNNEELGFFNGTDFCCREHDKCPQYILTQSDNYGLVNTDPYTRMSCDCDIRFKNCLHNVISFPWDETMSKIIGYIYYTALEDRCFEPSYTNSTKNISNPEYEWKRLGPF